MEAASPNVTLHLDSSAAKGILERQGSSKIRHLDVNILWMQDQEARNAINLKMFLGTINRSDLMTKYVGAAVIRDHLTCLQMEHRDGRSAKAARLHSLKKKARQEEYENKVASTKFESFTPYRVAKGPVKKVRFRDVRQTVGVTESGEAFAIKDNWFEKERAHEHLDERWTGVTTFFVEGYEDEKDGKVISQPVRATSPAVRWADID